MKMTRIPIIIPGKSAHMQLVARVSEHAKRLVGLSDEELGPKLQLGFARADSNYEFNRMFNRGVILGVEHTSEPVLEGLAAREVLLQRHGSEYVLNALGYRSPKGFIERVGYFITGNLPRNTKP